MVELIDPSGVVIYVHGVKHSEFELGREAFKVIFGLFERLVKPFLGLINRLSYFVSYSLR